MASETEAAPAPTTFEIRHRWTGRVQFSCELSAEVAGRSLGFRVGFAVRKAIEAGANLTGANLTRADLTGANLTDANLTRADLTGANLTRADLTDADLTGANLTGADLTGANLTRANLTGANLTRADLTGANLTRANLTDADLTGADLTGANLTGANLTRADLTGANLTRANLTDADLTGADLTAIKQDFLAEVLRLPNELEALRAALLEGRVDGSTYTGTCACLAGTLANAADVQNYRGDNIVSASGIVFHADGYSPRERFFLAIKQGDTPETNPASKVALEWTDEAIAVRDMIRATAQAVRP